jgi:nitrate/TMAO reductase-like tetraheme cytochrome c subunit
VSEPGTGGPVDEPEAMAAGAAGVEPGAAVAGGAGPDEATPRRRGLRGRVVNLRFRLPRSRKGIFALVLVIGAFGFAGIWTGATLIHWTETADFCGRCHQMGPELAAYESGPHNTITCGECHVEPGIDGWIKSKLNGTRQLVQVITGLYPQPIPPPEHSALPPVEDTCLHCHSLDRLATANLITRTTYAEDEPNTRTFVGLMVRPASGDVFDRTRSVHWHILEDVRLRTAEDDPEKIDWVSVNLPDGTLREFIGQDMIGLDASNVTPVLEEIKAAGEERQMDCIQCHNRVGHPIPNPRRGMDADLAAGHIDASLPYVKREGQRILWDDYPTEAAAFAAAEELETFYELRYPEVAATQGDEIDEAIEQIKILYRLTATPEMKVTAASYPDFLGHLDFPGCFRCHDGGHYLVEDGAVTKEVIPATCDTCHTYPQIGPAVASLPLGEPPVEHDDPLYVFNHKDVATSLDPGTQSCGECHARDYCINCHDTGAVTVDHDEMMTNHASSIRESGNQSCAYCHQPVYCARCHNEPVLPVTTPSAAGLSGPGPEGVRWPLVAAGPAAGP